MLLLSQTVRMEIALFHCSCMKGALSHKPLTCQIYLQGPLRAVRELNLLPLSLERPTGSPALFPLEAEVDAAWRGACPWQVIGAWDLSRPVEGLGYETGDAGMDFRDHKAVLGFAPGKMSPVIQGMMVYCTL